LGVVLPMMPPLSSRSRRQTCGGDRLRFYVKGPRFISNNEEKQMSQPKEPTVKVPPGTPRWITEELIADTLRVWQPYYPEALTAEDAIEILVNVTNFFKALRG